MRKGRILGVALFAAIAVTALATTTASATEWLKNGKALSGMEGATTHGTFIVAHKGGAMGNLKLECNVLLIGTVAPRGLGTLTLEESLGGSEKDLVKCKTLEGVACSEAVFHFLGTLLELEFPASEPGWLKVSRREVRSWKDLCLFSSIECESAFLRIKFEGNGPNGAKFAFKAAESGEESCSDGGTQVVESVGTAEVLGFTAS